MHLGRYVGREAGREVDVRSVCRPLSGLDGFRLLRNGFGPFGLCFYAPWNGMLPEGF